ncbi:S-layer homology domain-containing protein [Paenarthrobacter nitroguajacolicus]|uniref:S-layer homology domain-containing protein n=1 Tax=Paenarthrobacter nitroguajacolicus TaxID=211146 RepID=UPI000AA6E6E6|nr:S-layer homology domain-containing protein [Paenarthrobacter nitroguajacolicus]
MRAISRGRFRLAVILVAGIILATLPSGFESPAVAAATGSISGTVTVPAGVDVNKVNVTVSGPTYRTLGVNPSGEYTIVGLAAGEYSVRFEEDASPKHVYSTYYGSAVYEQSTRVDVAAGTAVTGIDQQMSTGGRIQGKVSVPAGTKASDMYVGVSSDSYQEGVAVAPDGSYDVGPLAPGDYTLNFSTSVQPIPVLQVYYPGVKDHEQAQKVSVADGDIVTGINQALKPAAIISGRLALPADAVPFSIFAEARSSIDLQGVSAVYVENGVYSIGGLEAGTYKLFFNASDIKIASMWHGGLPTAAASPTITVAAGERLTGPTDTAVPAGTITGSHTAGASNTDVQVVTADGTVVQGGFSTGPQSFMVPNLFPGTYKVQFNRSSGFTTAQEGQYYNNLPESSGLGSATSVTVAGGQTLTNINPTSRVGGTLSGKILGPGGAPLTNAPVRVYTKDGTLVTRKANTLVDGTFKVTGLSTGNYFVSAAPEGASGPIFSGNVLSETNARSVSTAPGRNTDIGTLSYATATQGTQAFDDVPLNAQFEEEILWLASKGISTGWEANGTRTYKPLSPVNRDAMAAFMYRLSGKPDFTAPGVSPFKDLPVGAQFYKEITWLADKGISTGWEEADKTKTYRPLQPVNRDAMAAFMYRLAGEPEFTAPEASPFVDVPVGAQFYKEITWLAAQGISTGWAETGNTKSFKPLLPVNRDAMAAFMFRYNSKFGTP